MDLIIDGLEHRKENSDWKTKAILDEAIGFIRQAETCLEDGLKDPEKWVKDNDIIMKTLMTMFPYIYLCQHIHKKSLESGESSQEEHVQSQSALDNLEPAIP
tara:strand:- start:1181 stop:1486 length:306 start_codon:yes stop_codon:yes gene_type:complete